MALKLKCKVTGQHILIVLAALVATLEVRPALALPADIPALPPGLATPYDAGQYGQVAAGRGHPRS